MIQTKCWRPVRRRVAYPLAGPNRSGALRRALEPRCVGQVHREAVAPTLAAGHFRRNVAELPPDVAFVDLGRRGQAGAQCPEDFSCRIAAYACGEREALDQARRGGRGLFGSDLPRTLATWRSLRSKGRDLWARFQASAESRGAIVATVRGLPPARAAPEARAAR